ncbi:DUF6989 domain-containing protein [Larkinella punicea]|uniref:DUF6989 domain-containing protein n=1 Tax=Larkinella punicea TaxID=2315727 RepID=A0A368JTV4_9BACT|nr:hypothetical protein [Larkinella punicea]RCR69611.1 hypothetical protein DUE52_09690 [Larkinella punicea]
MISLPVTRHHQRIRTYFILLTLGLVLGIGIVSDRYRLGWQSAAWLAYGTYAVLVLFAWLYHDLFLRKLLLFGLIAGVGELLADWWLVDATGTLIYPNNEPMLIRSPLYMPFAWAVILVQIGYLGWLVSTWKPMGLAVLAAALLGLSIIPLMEHWAKDAGWWYYVHCQMIGSAPLYIIVGEGVICTLLPVFFRRINNRSGWSDAIGLGLAQGAWIWLAYVICYYLFR